VGVCPGYAVGPHGNEIQVQTLSTIDLREFLWSSPALLSTVNIHALAYLAIRYDETVDHLEVIPGVPCQCKEPVYRETRTVDAFRLGVLWRLPELVPQEGICTREGAPCAPCPDSPWLILARIHLPSSSTAQITAAMIDNDIRSTF
jgi:hypothetical protein